MSHPRTGIGRRRFLAAGGGLAIAAMVDGVAGGVAAAGCVTCLYSGYSPGEHGLLGISCRRGAKDQYLAVRSEADYRSVPITEEAPETYLCRDYQRRVRGTGWRG